MKTQNIEGCTGMFVKQPPHDSQVSFGEEEDRVEFVGLHEEDTISTLSKCARIPESPHSGYKYLSAFQPIQHE